MFTNGEIYIKVCAKQCAMINIKVACAYVMTDGVYLHEYVDLFLVSGGAWQRGAAGAGTSVFTEPMAKFTSSPAFRSAK
jgi:hypothetical protein